MVSFGRQKSGSQSEQFSSSVSRAESGTLAQSGQNVWGAQIPALESLYGGAMGLMQQPNQAAAPAMQAWQQALTPGVNPYFSQSLENAISAATTGFTRDVLPQLRANAVGAGEGVLGGPRDQLAQGQAAGQFGEGLTRMVGDMAAQQYGADQNRMIQALGMAPQMGALGSQNLQTAAGIIGAPTTLGSSLSQSYSRGTTDSAASGWGGSKSGGFNFGIMSGK